MNNMTLKTSILGLAVLLSFSSLSAAVISSIEELDEASLFHFSIMSDNKGDGPEAGHVAKWAEWAKSSEFCLGLGDNLQHEGEPFLHFIRDDEHWREHFYPNIGDGENQHYSGSQGDWGAGAEMFNIWDGTPYHFYDRTEVTFRPVSGSNNDRLADYRHDFTKDGFTITTFSLHFSDQYDGSMNPAVRGVGLAYVTTDWLFDQLSEIKTQGKSDKHIILVIAHCDTWQRWIDLLVGEKDEVREMIMTTADLVVGATTHMYGWRSRFKDENGGNGPIIFNSGSLGNSSTTNGYMEMHVLDGPPRLAVQYISTEHHDSRTMQTGAYNDFSFYPADDGPGGGAEDQRGTPLIKTINGPYEEIEWDDFNTGEVGTVNPNQFTHAFQSDDITVSPNVSSPERIVEFFVSDRAMVTLSLLDNRGRLVKRLYNRNAAPGINTVSFNTAPFAPGIYYLQGHAGQNKLVKQFLIMK